MTPRPAITFRATVSPSCSSRARNTAPIPPAPSCRSTTKRPPTRLPGSIPPAGESVVSASCSGSAAGASISDLRYPDDQPKRVDEFQDLVDFYTVYDPLKVTQADREAEQVVVSALRRAFEGDGLVAEESGGNPYFAFEILRSLRERGTIVQGVHLAGAFLHNGVDGFGERPGRIERHLLALDDAGTRDQEDTAVVADLEITEFHASRASGSLRCVCSRAAAM